MGTPKVRLRAGRKVQGSETLRGRRILVVEDEAMVSMMLESTLSAAGGVVVGPVPSANAALALLAQEAVDCAVLDVKLLDGPSLPVAEALSARGIPFVISTGYESIPHGYNGARILRKVFMPEDLINAIADILSA